MLKRLRKSLIDILFIYELLWLSANLLLDERFVSYYANKAHQEKDWDATISCSSILIRVDPQNARAYFGRGIARSNKKEFEDALADLDEAIRLNPKFGHAYLQRGYIHFVKNDQVKGLADYSEAIRLDPADWQALYLRADVYAKKGILDKAIADYSASLKIKKSAKGFERRGYCHAERKEYDEAIKDCNRSPSKNLKTWRSCGGADFLA